MNVGGAAIVWRLPAHLAGSLWAGILDALPAPSLQELVILTNDAESIEVFRSLAQSDFRPQSLANDLTADTDRLSIEAEAAAIAESLLLRDVQPPLSVGILGGWGAGKSFVLRLMQKKMADIRSLDAAQDQFPYAGHIYQIRFDAWTYSKSSLWASLMQTIFVEISRQLGLEQIITEELQKAGRSPQDAAAVWKVLSAPDADRRALLDQTDVGKKVIARLIQEPGDSTDRLWNILDATKKEEKDRLQVLEKQLASERAELEKARHAHTADLAWKPILQRLEKLGIDAAKFEPGLGLLDLSPAVRDLFRMAWKNPALLCAFLALFVVLPAGLPWIADWLEGLRLPGAVLAFVTSALGFLRFLAKGKQSIEQAYGDYRKQLEEVRSRPPATMTVEIEEQGKKVQALEQQVGEQRRRAGVTGRYRTLIEFVNSRLDEAAYEKELGLMHRVQRDLEELSDALLAHPDAFPRGPARIVLFIDDLDRCPPARVVEVLEATQLLLKTPLFVVVLAMDVRFITRALEKAYEHVLTRRGEPSGLDYIEKIVQIPYQVRPILAENMAGYLGAQMEVRREAVLAAASAEADSETPSETQLAPPAPAPAPPVRKIEFTKDEFAWLTRCCNQVELSPRAVKRLANVYKLLKIVWFRKATGAGPGPSGERSVLALLALSARYPHLMRDLFEQVDAALKFPASDLTMAACIASCKPPTQYRLMRDRWKRLSADAEALSLSDLRLRDIDRLTLDRVRSFSFVAEIGYDPADLTRERLSASLSSARRSPPP